MAFEDRYNRAQFPVTLGAPVVFNLPAGDKVLSGKIIVSGVLTITGANAAGTKIGDNALVNLVQRVLVLANKAAGSRYYNGALVNCDPQSLLRYAMTQRSGKYVDDLFGQTLNGGVAGAYPVYLEIPIYFATKNSLGGYSTALNMDTVDGQGNPVYTAVQVRVDFAATLNQLFYGSGNAMTFAGLCEWRDDRLAITSDTTPLVQEAHELYIQNANWRLVDQAMPNNGAFTQWLIMSQIDAQTTTVLADTIINEIKAQGSTLNLKEYWQDIRAEMIDAGFFDPSQTLTGLYFFDWTHGLLANTNPANGLQHEFAVNNPSGAGNDRLRIYTRRAFGLR
jgi:hypothetical protein